ncbi:hypothetical protein M408DRAFT_29997 [Serendipita vermifera MAFF 305830]|uniref:F-box domain-containing protein n=1 Tax=Serendipita vermifera MAFF 305830 TaxID=933852 RepID=A0A0C3ANN2_SERVB|nr:hypothetical protein M408DRAFT_29997 [Serendipita vermifera MAFF 305830]
MNHSIASIKYRDSDLIVNLLAQRTKILTRLIDNRNVPSMKPQNDSTIRYLQKEYNHVTERIAQLEYQPLSDPMKVLPLELCADIIEEAVTSPSAHSPVDNLLDLTTVSRLWRDILMSLPTLWTSIVFDSTEGDYLAKAAVCLFLSGACDLRVTIAVPFKLWPEISPIILAESGRIVYLQITYPPLDTGDSEKILHDFESLSVLKTLFLPTEYSSRTFESHPRNIEFEKMPLLSNILGTCPEPLEYLCSRFVNSRTFRVPAITQDMVDVWATFPDLNDVYINEYGVLPGYSPKTFELSLPSVQVFKYHGRALERALNLLRPNITSITVEVHEFRQVLDILGRFPRIYHLGLIVSRTFNSREVTIGITQTSYRSVERLEIRGDTYYRTDTAEPEDAINSWGLLYRALISILPCVKMFVLADWLFTNDTWLYISSLEQLHVLIVSDCRFHLSNSQSVVTMEYLSYISWSVPSDSVVILSKIMAPSLLTLEVKVIADELVVDAMVFSIPETAFPNLVSLTVILAKSLSWNTGVYKNLRELRLQSRFSYKADLMIRSDILETILMSPRDFPVLDTIELAGSLFEGDILLLMLERKNIYAQPGISPIKTIVMYKPIPYRLLYPITTLLRGKFPDREPNVAFSLDAVGQQLVVRPVALLFANAWLLSNQDPTLMNTVHSIKTEFPNIRQKRQLQTLL